MPVVAVLHHLERPFLGQVEGPLRAAGIEIDERHVISGAALPDLDRVDGIVALGGEMSVLDIGDYPALQAEAALLREAVERRVPTLGICLGGQLLAHALGGTVSRAGRVLEWRELEPTEATAEDPLFGAIPLPVPALHFNQDVFDLPPGAVELLVAAGARQGVEAFRAGECAWAVQYHPDVDAATLERWHTDFAPWIEEAGADVERLLAEQPQRLRVQDAASAALFGAFARVVSSVPAR